MVYTTHKHGKSISIWGWWILWILLLCWVPCRAAQGKDEMLLAKRCLFNQLKAGLNRLLPGLVN